MRLETLPPLRTLIAEHGLSAAKSFGQHFLLDLNITRKIVRLSGLKAGETALEIGPGPGGLTRALLETEAAAVIAVEKDVRCIELLQGLARAAEGRLTLHHGDALALPLEEIAQKGRVIANLPYNVGTLILLKLLENITSYQSLTLMFQREVAERLFAAPSTPAYGRLSVLAQVRCTGGLVMHLPASAFVPPPKVASSVVHLVPRPQQPPDAVMQTLEQLTAAAFGQRRKMLRSSLKKMHGAVSTLEECDIAADNRAENLSPEDFLRLAKALTLTAENPY